MAPYSGGHEHHLLPVSEHPQDDFCRQGSCRIYPHVSMGSSQPEGDSGRTSIGRRKPELAVCERRIEEENQPRPRFTQTFRLLWVLLSRVWIHGIKWRTSCNSLHGLGDSDRRKQSNMFAGNSLHLRSRAFFSSDGLFRGDRPQYSISEKDRSTIAPFPQTFTPKSAPYPHPGPK